MLEWSTLPRGSAGLPVASPAGPADASAAGLRTAAKAHAAALLAALSSGALLLRGELTPHIPRRHFTPSAELAQRAARARPSVHSSTG